MTDDPRRPSNPLLSAVLDNAAVGTWRWDIASQRVEWSPGLEKLLGLAPGSFGGTFDDYLAVIPGEEREQVTVAIRRALEAGEPYELDHRVLVPGGESRWVTCRGQVIRDDGGKPSGMAGVVWDVTRPRNAEESLRRSEERLRFQAVVLAEMNEAVIATDITANITYWNEAAERLYGYSAAEAVGRNGTELLKTIWPNADDATAHVTALRSVGSWRGEMVHTTKSGASIVVHASIRILREAGKPIAGVTVMQDVTARKKLEEQLRHSQKMEAIGVLAGGVAHDFNNLLGVILGFTELTLERFPRGDADAAWLHEVVAAAKRGGDLTRKLLAFSRKQVMRMVPLDLGAAVANTAKLLERIVGEDVHFVVTPAEGPLVVRADALQIEQVLFNLCTNARQAMPRGGTLTVAARRVVVDDAFARKHQWARAGEFAELTVTDTGIGMDAATLDRAFEPFFTTKEQGTGLGLAMVYGIVEQHGGVVHADSVAGSGATFRVHLPLDREPLVLESLQRSEPAAPGGDETILIAEDAAPLRALVTTTLAALGYRVIAAENGEQAVREYEQRAGEIALVVLDVIMPKLGALEAYARMRAVRPDVKVLFMTGYAPEATQLAGLLDGKRLHLLEKPFSSRALGVSVRQAIDAG